MFLTNFKNLKLNQIRRHKSTAISSLDWPIDKVRQTYLDYFCKKKAHKFIRSSTVLPRKGSGTYFTNAGMNQFKSIILGELNAEKIIDFNKYIGVANSQKCIRIGGKHNDLDDIGKDTYHHSFFEMLGNWSFNGSYTNEKACEMALDLLVNNYKLNLNGLYFTYFCGNRELGLQSDLTTKNIWLKLGIPERQILPFDMKDNFWEMDQIGPCGPCTEIHYDRLVNTNRNDFHKSRDLVNAGTERVIELWNIVFMNYNRINKSTFSRLQNPVIDTGMGLERLTAVLNNLSSNYDSDAFTSLFSTIHKHSNLREYKSYTNIQDPISVAYRTLSDYMRSITVSIGDGLVPSRNGLGGFLKYLILNSLKMTRDVFHVEKPTDLLCELVSDVVDNLSSTFPELKERKAYIQEVIRQTDELQKMKQTNWSEITDRYLKKLKINNNKNEKLSGEQVWKLFKGDGTGDEISIDFIEQKLKEKQIDFDMQGFNRLYLAHNEKAIRNQKQSQNKNNNADLITNLIDLANEIKHLPKTNDSLKYDFDLNTQQCEAVYKNKSNLKSKIISLAVRDKNKFDEKFKISNDQNLDLNKEYIIILDKSNFYSESGGQSSDKGFLINKDCKFEITHCYNIHGYTFHLAKLVESTSSNLNLINQEFELTVDSKLRYNLSLNHTGVHLLNHSIRKAFDHENSIIQVQSSVRNHSFKFEFKIFNQLITKLSLNIIEKIQQECQNLIQKSLPVFVENDVDLDDLKFDNEKKLRKLNDILYPNKVRIVSVGSRWSDFTNSQNKNHDDYSAELCCGTHVSNTSQLDNLIITHMNVIGDSSFEIEATSGRMNTDEIQKNDELCQHYLNEMKLLYAESNSKNYSELNSYEKLKDLNEIADISARIENIFKSSPTSYLNQQKIKEEATSYRPSKHQLQIALKKHFEDELGFNSPKAINSAVIASINPKSNLSIKFLAFDSLLHHDQIISILNKIENIHPALIIYNSLRECYYFYAKNGIEKDNELKAYFDSAQEKMNSQNQSTSNLIESNDKYRIIKCPLRLNKSTKMGYFNF